MRRPCAKSTAGVIFVDSTVQLIPERNFLVTNNPSQAFQQVVDAIHANAHELSGFSDIHPTAIVHPSCTVGSNVTIGPYAVIDKDVIIGANTMISSGCYIGPATTLGSDCLLHPQSHHP